MSKQRYGIARVLVAGLFLAVALAYSFVNPPFESPDEIYHLDYVEQLLRTGHLPVAKTAEGVPGEQNEYHQPPLYYLAGALMTAWLPPGEPASAAIERNPFWAWRIADVGTDNKAQFLHKPDQAFPYQGIFLRLHLVRVLSVLLGLVTVLGTMQLALLFWPEAYALSLVAGAFVAFLPQFLLITSSVTNDIAAIAVSTLIAVMVARLLLYPEHRLHHIHVMLLGVLMGCALLVKMSLIVVVVLAVLAVAAGNFLTRREPRSGRSRDAGSRTRRAHVRIYDLGTALGISLLIAGPYLWRNWQLYGDPTALSSMDAIWGRRQPPLTLLEVWSDVPSIWTSFWGRFGYGQIPMPDGVYTLCVILTIVGLGGLILASIERRRPRTWEITRAMALVFALVLVLGYIGATINYARTSYTGAFGRFVFPALAPAAVLLAVGWLRAGAALRISARATAAGLTLGFFLLSVWALLAILRPAYTFAQTSVATLEGQTGLNLADMALLTGVKVLNPSLPPGGDALVQVDWLTVKQSTRPLSFVIQLLGPEGELLGDRTSYPALGKVSTTFWQPGQSFTDLYAVPVDAELARRLAPIPVKVAAFFYDREADKILPVYAPGSRDVLSPPIVAEARLAPPPFTPAGTAVEGEVVVGDVLRLDGTKFAPAAKAGDTLTVELDWSVLQPIPYETKVFLHLTSMSDGKRLAQTDEEVLRGRYPAQLWTAGERLQDMHELALPADLPPGTYHLLMGMYPSADWSQRLPIRGPASRLLDNSFDMGTVEITQPAN